MSTLTIDEVEKLVADISYKPGWSFIAAGGPDGGIHFRVMAPVPNANNPIWSKDILTGVVTYESTNVAEDAFLPWEKE